MDFQQQRLAKQIEHLDSVIDKIAARIAELRAAGADADTLDIYVGAHANHTARRYDLARQLDPTRASWAGLMPQRMTLVEDADYLRWRDTKRRIGQLMRANPVIQRLSGGGWVRQTTLDKHAGVLADHRQLVADLKQIEDANGHNLDDWQQRAWQDRAANQDTPKQPTSAPTMTPTARSDAQDSKPPESDSGATVRIDPALAAFLLDHDNRLHGKPIAPVGRLWYGLRSLANDSGGAIAYDQAVEVFTGKGSPLRMFGQRQLKALLARGEDVFWTRNKDRRGNLRIWLRGVVSVADALGVGRFYGSAVDLPVDQIVGADWKAALYAAWVAGRGDNPMTRNVKAGLSGCSTYRQRNYETAAGVEVRRNYCINSRYSDDNLKRARYVDHRAAFQFVDRLGRYGDKGQAYVAWHLPNSDTAPVWCSAIHNKRSRTLNGKLTVRDNLQSGNGDLVRVFFEDVEAANRVAAKDANAQAYYQTVSAHYYPGAHAGFYFMAGRGGR